MNAPRGTNDTLETTVEERLRKAIEEPDPYEDRYLAFVDILGWKSVVKASENDRKSLGLASFAAELVKAAKDGALSLNESLKSRPDGSFDLDIRVSHFSDSFVFSLPNTPLSEIISTILQSVSMGLLEKGHYTRGAIVLGKVRHSCDGSVLFGPAMNDAYELERNVAKYPRIVVGNSAQSLFGLPGALRTDFDGLKHLNVLGYATPESIPRLEGLRKIAEDKEMSDRDCLGLVAKHRWFRAYVEEVLQDARAKTSNGSRIHNALARLRLAAMRLPESDRPAFGSGASIHEVDAFEHEVGVLLPADFRTLLQLSEAIENAGTINWCSIGSVAQLTLLFAEGKHSRTIANDPSSKLIPIAKISFCTILVSSGDGSVWRWDSEQPELEKVAETVSAFLERVAEDWEHAAQDDKDWQYLCRRWS